MSFERLLNPRSIAVFGGAQAQEVIRQSDRMGYKGEIWPVHPKKTEILGRRVYRSVADLPASPDAAYVGVNRKLTIDIVRDLAARDSGGAVCYATGFIEAGEEGSELQEQLLEASGDMPLVGPNCYGILNYLNGAMLWPDQQGGQRVDKGVAIITMSSNVGFNLTMQRRGLPVAYMISLGNKLKFDLHDAIHTFARQDQVTALGLYVETMPDPRAFQKAVNVARELGKPIVAIKTGRSEVAKKMVVSHTASLAGSDVLVSALFARLGVARVDSLEALMEALKVLHVLGPLSGGRIGAMSTSGGDLTLLADAMGPDLSMPPLSEKVAQRLAATIHERVVATSGWWPPIRLISRCLTGMMRTAWPKILAHFYRKISTYHFVCSTIRGKAFATNPHGVVPKGVLFEQQSRPTPKPRCWQPFRIQFVNRWRSV
jgi:acyl-CoA synthetase (NDP forming)